MSCALPWKKAPTPPMNSVSPENSASPESKGVRITEARAAAAGGGGAGGCGRPSTTNATWPRVWHGVWTTSTRVAPMETVSPSATDRLQHGTRSRAPPTTTSSRPPRARTAATSAALPPAWSWWRWVVSMWVSSQEAADAARSTLAASAGSTAAASRVAVSTRMYA